MSSGGRVVLVTGAAGFLGAELSRLLVARGDALHVVARPSTDVSALAGIAHVAHRADVEDEPSLRRALDAAARDARARRAPLDVVHLAARISYRRADRELLRRVNVEGTRSVLAAAAAAGARRFCHVGSVVALGAVPRPDVELDDDAPLGGLALDSAYARTKAEAEQLVMAASERLDVVVASPAVVFGMGASSNSLHFLRRIVRGGFAPLTPPGSLSVVGLSDAADGIARVLERGERGRRYLLAESAWRLHDLFALACELAERGAPLGRVPAPLWPAVVAGAALAERARRSERATPEALALLGQHFRFRARRARAELGWSPRPFAGVLAEIVAALRAETAQHE